MTIYQVDLTDNWWQAD